MTPVEPPTRRPGPIPATRSWGIGLAFATAVISGVAIYVNSFAVKRFPDATTYTTAKNLTAAALLGALLVAATARRSAEGWTSPRSTRQSLGLVLVAVVGGSVPFVLFFEGLSRASSTDASFIHKTLVVWVAVLAVAFLGERLSWPHVAAIAAIVGGQVVLTGSLSGIRPDSAEIMILAATLLWSVEVVVAKSILASLSPLTVGTSRMVLGAVILLGWTAARGELGSLLGLDPAQWGWVAVTGVLLTAYVTTWYSALARAQAVDVTAVLVIGVLVTAVLDTTLQGAPIGPDLVGLGLIAAGVLVIVRWAQPRRGEVTT